MKVVYGKREDEQREAGCLGSWMLDFLDVGFWILDFGCGPGSHLKSDTNYGKTPNFKFNFHITTFSNFQICPPIPTPGFHS